MKAWWLEPIPLPGLQVEAGKAMLLVSDQMVPDVCFVTKWYGRMVLIEHQHIQVRQVNQTGCALRYNKFHYFQAA